MAGVKQKNGAFQRERRGERRRREGERRGREGDRQTDKQTDRQTERSKERGERGEGRGKSERVCTCSNWAASSVRADRWSGSFLKCKDVILLTKLNL